MKAGSIITVPELPGRWSVWSKSDECLGAHFVVPPLAGLRVEGSA